MREIRRRRPLIAFFDYPDIFEDFYPHYGVTREAFVRTWMGTGNHAFVSLLQREIGDVVWYSTSLSPEVLEAQHEGTGCTVKMLPSSWLHRQLWRAFYLPSFAWRWQHGYPAFAAAASFLAPMSLPLLRELRQDAPNFMFVQDYGSGRFDVLLLLARWLRARLIAYHSGSVGERYVGRFSKRWSIPRADYLIASSQGELERLARHYGVPGDRLRVVLTPIDTFAFRPIERTIACRRANLDPCRRYLLFAGRLDDEVKRVSAIIRSFAAISAQYPDVDLLLAGGGPDERRLRSLARSSGVSDRVRFLGWLSGAESLAHLYSAAECLVLPSLSEGFPTVVGEAMACGAPVLASRVGGIPELVVEGRSGWLIPPGDDGALSRALKNVLSHPGLAAGMRQEARRLAEARVSPAAVADALRPCFSDGPMAHV